MNNKIKELDRYIVGLQKLFFMKLNRIIHWLTRDTLMIINFKKNKNLLLVNTYNMMIYSGLLGIGSKQKLV